MIENVNIYLNYHYQFANILKCVLGCASFMLMEFFLSAIKADSSVKAISMKEMKIRRIGYE